MLRKAAPKRAAPVKPTPQCTQKRLICTTVLRVRSPPFLRLHSIRVRQFSNPASETGTAEKSAVPIEISANSEGGMTRSPRMSDASMVKPRADALKERDFEFQMDLYMGHLLHSMLLSDKLVQLQKLVGPKQSVLLTLAKHSNAIRISSNSIELVDRSKRIIDDNLTKHMRVILAGDKIWCFSGSKMNSRNILQKRTGALIHCNLGTKEITILGSEWQVQMAYDEVQRRLSETTFIDLDDRCSWLVGEQGWFTKKIIERHSVELFPLRTDELSNGRLLLCAPMHKTKQVLTDIRERLSRAPKTAVILDRHKMDLARLAEKVKCVKTTVEFAEIIRNHSKLFSETKSRSRSHKNRQLKAIDNGQMLSEPSHSKNKLDQLSSSLDDQMIEESFKAAQKRKYLDLKKKTNNKDSSLLSFDTPMLDETLREIQQEYGLDKTPEELKLSVLEDYEKILRNVSSVISVVFAHIKEARRLELSERNRQRMDVVSLSKKAWSSDNTHVIGVHKSRSILEKERMKKEEKFCRDLIHTMVKPVLQLTSDIISNNNDDNEEEDHDQSRLFRNKKDDLTLMNLGTKDSGLKTSTLANIIEVMSLYDLKRVSKTASLQPGNMNSSFTSHFRNHNMNNDDDEQNDHHSLLFKEQNPCLFWKSIVEQALNKCNSQVIFRRINGKVQSGFSNPRNVDITQRHRFTLPGSPNTSSIEQSSDSSDSDSDGDDELSSSSLLISSDDNSGDCFSSASMLVTRADGTPIQQGSLVGYEYTCLDEWKAMLRINNDKWSILQSLMRVTPDYNFMGDHGLRLFRESLDIIQAELFALKQRREKNVAMYVRPEEDGQKAFLTHGLYLSDAGRIAGMLEVISSSSIGLGLYHASNEGSEKNAVRELINGLIFLLSFDDITKEIPNMTCFHSSRILCSLARLLDAPEYHDHALCDRLRYEHEESLSLSSNNSTISEWSIPDRLTPSLINQVCRNICDELYVHMNGGGDRGGLPTECDVILGDPFERVVSAASVSGMPTLSNSSASNASKSRNNNKLKSTNRNLGVARQNAQASGVSVIGSQTKATELVYPRHFDALCTVASKLTDDLGFFIGDGNPNVMPVMELLFNERMVMEYLCDTPSHMMNLTHTSQLLRSLAKCGYGFAFTPCLIDNNNHHNSSNVTDESESRFGNRRWNHPLVSLVEPDLLIDEDPSQLRPSDLDRMADKVSGIGTMDSVKYALYRCLARTFVANRSAYSLPELIETSWSLILIDTMLWHCTGGVSGSNVDSNFAGDNNRLLDISGRRRGGGFGDVAPKTSNTILSNKELSRLIKTLNGRIKEFECGQILNMSPKMVPCLLQMKELIKIRTGHLTAEPRVRMTTKDVSGEEKVTEELAVSISSESRKNRGRRTMRNGGGMIQVDTRHEHLRLMDANFERMLRNGLDGYMSMQRSEEERSLKEEEQMNSDHHCHNNDNDHHPRISEVYYRSRFVSAVKDCLEDVVIYDDTPQGSGVGSSDPSRRRGGDFLIAKDGGNLERIYEKNSFGQRDLILSSGMRIDLCIDDRKKIALSCLGPSETFVNGHTQLTGFAAANDWILSEYQGWKIMHVGWDDFRRINEDGNPIGKHEFKSRLKYFLTKTKFL